MRTRNQQYSAGRRHYAENDWAKRHRLPSRHRKAVAVVTHKRRKPIK